MLKQIRQQTIYHLWETYKQSSHQTQWIEAGIKQKTAAPLVLDHFAIIDLPGPHTGIPVLTDAFSLLGFTVKGRDYLPDKQNDFCWLAEESALTQKAKDTLPQIVVADFRLAEMPLSVREVIEKYSSQSAPLPFAMLQQLKQDALRGEKAAGEKMQQILTTYLKGRDWPLPTVAEFSTVHAFNELLAWVLVFGRRPNHFTLSIHLLDAFHDFPHFLHFIEQTLQLPLNEEGGKIKGTESAGIQQSSTQGLSENIMLADGAVTIPCDFVEFVWRHPLPHLKQKPIFWSDYFTGFIATHANQVIESLFLA